MVAGIRELIVPYLVPIVLAVLLVVGLSVVLGAVWRAGHKPEEDPAIRAVLERRQGRSTRRRRGDQG